MNNVEAISDFIFIGKKFEELRKYDLLIINADYAEKEAADLLMEMHNKNIIDDKTTFLICDGHSGGKENSANILINYLKEYKLNNNIIVDTKYITNPEILRNIDKLVDLKEYNSILRMAKAFVARRWYMNAKRYDFPIEKCDFYGIVDGRNIDKTTWYLSETGINQVMKEFINIGQLTIEGELNI